MTITIRDIRAQAVTHTLFTPTTLGAAIDALGFVQADPIRAPASAQDLILRHRVAGYRAGDLERGYRDLDLEEDVLHVYGFLPSPTLDLLHPRHGERQLERDHPGLAEQVLEFVRSNGETHHRQLEAHFGAIQTRGGWGGWARATTRMLDLLHYRGLLRVARREGNRRWFVAAPPRTPLADSDERLRRLVLLLARLYAPIAEPTLRLLVSRLGYAAPSLSGRRGAVARLLKEGALEGATVDDLLYLWPAGEWIERDVPREVRLLAPFDPLVADRERFEHLWGWPYRFEAYTPPAKRRWGYYALPMLWDDEVIGWANLSVRDRELQADLGFVHGRPVEADFDAALEAELARVSAFLGLARPDDPA